MCCCSLYQGYWLRLRQKACTCLNQAGNLGNGETVVTLKLFSVSSVQRSCIQSFLKMLQNINIVTNIVFCAIKRRRFQSPKMKLVPTSLIPGIYNCVKKILSGINKVPKRQTRLRWVRPDSIRMHAHILARQESLLLGTSSLILAHPGL